MEFLALRAFGPDRDFGLRRDASDKKGSTWRIFSLKELHAATNNFNYDNKLGEGGFGSVYWGQLWDGSNVRPVLQIVNREQHLPKFAEKCRML